MLNKTLLILSMETALERIQNGHGLLITVIGLFAVFSGLIILWGVTAAFPQVICWFRQNKSLPRSPEPGQQIQPDEQVNEIIAVLSITLHLELEEEEVSILTLKNTEQEMSPWVVASRPTIMRHSS